MLSEQKAKIERHGGIYAPTKKLSLIRANVEHYISAIHLMGEENLRLIPECRPGWYEDPKAYNDLIFRYTVKSISPDGNELLLSNDKTGPSRGRLLMSNDINNDIAKTFSLCKKCKSITSRGAAKTVGTEIYGIKDHWEHLNSNIKIMLKKWGLKVE